MVQNEQANLASRRVVLCGAVATALGMSYMAAAGAPATYLAINAAAFAIGVAVLALAWRLRLRASAGAVCLGLGVVLLLCFFAGTAVSGATRWLRLGNIVVQPSLLLVPVLALSFARSRDALGVAGVWLAALVLALQPDRAMAAALAAGLMALVLVRPTGSTFVAAAAAVSAFAAAMFRPDTQGAMPFVDRIYYTSFDVHELAGLAVLSGSIILLLPAIIGRPRGGSMGASRVVFGAVWAAIIAAAALGNYPTPLVGYGGSAILGYLLCSLAFPGTAGVAKGVFVTTAQPDPADEGSGRLLLGA